MRLRTLVMDFTWFVWYQVILLNSLSISTWKCFLNSPRKWEWKSIYAVSEETYLSVSGTVKLTQVFARFSGEMASNDNKLRKRKWTPLRYINDSCFLFSVVFMFWICSCMLSLIALSVFFVEIGLILLFFGMCVCFSVFFSSFNFFKFCYFCVLLFMCISCIFVCVLRVRFRNK